MNSKTLFLLLVSFVLFDECLSAAIAKTENAAVEKSDIKKRSKRQIVPPLHLGLGSGMGMGFGVGLGGLGGLGYGGIGLGGIGLGPLIPPPFGRPVPGGVHAGRIGGIGGSPVFGPGLIGPFNHPIAREERIEELANLNRRINGRGPINTPVALLEYGYGYPFYY